MIVFGVILASAAVISLAAFVALVVGVRVTEHRASLRYPSGSRIDRFTRRVLGVYTDQASRNHYDSEVAEQDTVRR